MRGKLFVGALLALVLSGVYASANLVQFTVAAAASGCSGTGTIAVDANSTSGASWTPSVSSLSWSHTVTGSNPILFVDIAIFSAVARTVSGITYNGVALSKDANATITAAVEASNQDSERWRLVGPATGANTIAVTLSGTGDFVAGVASSYTGVNQTTPVDNQAVGQNTAGTTSFSQAVTVGTGTKCWLTGFSWNRSGTAGAGAGTTIRASYGVGSFLANADSNATVSAGSRSLTYTQGAAAVWPGAVTTSIAPTP